MHIKSAALFPGQGSQMVGMGQALAAHPVTAPLFAEANEALCFDLASLMAQGPTETLTRTINAQPALFVVGYAAYHYWRACGGAAPVLMAGHSLGEYTALAAAGVFSFAEGVKLVQARGLAMSQAYPEGGAMAAVLGMNIDVLQEITASAGCVVANDNCPGQVVMSGTCVAVEKAAESAKASGAKRVVMLPVSGPFHSPLMGSALPALAEAMANVGFKNATIPVVMNVTAQPEREAFAIKQHLLAQLTGPVRWRETVQTLAALGVTDAYEFGVGRVLGGLVGKCSEKIVTHSLTSPAEMDSLLASQKQE